MKLILMVDLRNLKYIVSITDNNVLLLIKNYDGWRNGAVRNTALRVGLNQ